MFHPARPSLTWSIVANCRATVNGSLYVVGQRRRQPDMRRVRRQVRQQGQRLEPVQKVRMRFLADVKPVSEENEVQLRSLGLPR